MAAEGARPLLVLGPGRGGTSLLAALMDSHPDMQVLFEKHAEELLMHAVIGNTLEARMQNGAPALHQACERYRAGCPLRWWGNKITTEQLSGLQVPAQRFSIDADALFTYFFDTVFADYALVFIQRDGRTCVRSKMARTGQDLEAACRRWEFSVAVQTFLHRHPRAHCMHYEDLVAAPTTVLEPLCDFLGLPFEGAMLDGTGHTGLNADYRHGVFARSRLSLEGVPEGAEHRLAKALVAAGYRVDPS
ncbi:sulfotransferase family protein [Algiphilus sp.]|uniref:sulfotransferase family protein n=1 Tax=Algiphilus sp. TaxID=1872431 RepID=UPI003B520CE6